MNNTDEFIRGQKACRNGEPHKAHQSKDYDRGFGFDGDITFLRENYNVGN